MIQARLPLLALLLPLAACASPSAEYPSLAVRDAERWTGTMAAGEAEPYVPVPPGVPTLERAAQLVTEARSLHAEFLAAAPNVRSRVSAAQGASVGSDSWAVAQVAVADLEARRSRVMVALADLDLIYAETSNAGEAIAPVADERDAVAAMVEEESALIADLLARLAR
ncbi:MAG: hypothetical protein JY451_01450 [Erythrobacter sp.]|nr:MAG: hypothetical protein JY451_01450 [Erythrobacter sp.]